MSIQTLIETALSTQFEPEALEVENESHQHAGGAGRESHFRCVIVAECFDGRSLIERHRAVHAALEPALARGVHALSIHAYTPAEWTEREHQSIASPPCAGAGRG